MTINHLVFDMGGVLIDIDWHGQMSRLLGRDIPFEQIHALWGASQAVNRFETGLSDLDSFANEFITEQGLSMHASDFKQAFHDIIIGVFPGVNALLEELQPNFTLSLLSNTNKAHWQQVQNDYDFLNYFHNPFTSIDFGIMKPEPEIYQELVRRLNTEPASILFFDDGACNVEVAREQGLNAERVFNPADVRRVLNDYQLLDDSNG